MAKKSNIHLIKQTNQKTSFILKPAISTIYGAIKYEISGGGTFHLFLSLSAAGF